MIAKITSTKAQLLSLYCLRSLSIVMVFKARISQIDGSSCFVESLIVNVTKSGESFNVNLVSSAAILQ